MINLKDKIIKFSSVKSKKLILNSGSDRFYNKQTTTDLSYNILQDKSNYINQDTLKKAAKLGLVKTKLNLKLFPT